MMYGWVFMFALRGESRAASYIAQIPTYIAASDAARRIDAADQRPTDSVQCTSALCKVGGISTVRCCVVVLFPFIIAGLVHYRTRSRDYLCRYGDIVKVQSVRKGTVIMLIAPLSLTPPAEVSAVAESDIKQDLPAHH